MHYCWSNGIENSVSFLSAHIWIAALIEWNMQSSNVNTYATGALSALYNIVFIFVRHDFHRLPLRSLIIYRFIKQTLIIIFSIKFRYGSKRFCLLAPFVSFFIVIYFRSLSRTANTLEIIKKIIARRAKYIRLFLPSAKINIGLWHGDGKNVDCSFFAQTPLCRPTSPFFLFFYYFHLRKSRRRIDNILYNHGFPSVRPSVQ